jgi:hypothetical protein
MISPVRAHILYIPRLRKVRKFWICFSKICRETVCKSCIKKSLLTCSKIFFYNNAIFHHIRHNKQFQQAFFVMKYGFFVQFLHIFLRCILEKHIHDFFTFLSRDMCKIRNITIISPSDIDTITIVIPIEIRNLLSLFLRNIARMARIFLGFLFTLWALSMGKVWVRTGVIIWKSSLVR